MEVKKNPKVDLNRNSGLYFVIGLTVVLFLTWRALEYKTYPKDNLVAEALNVVDDLKEEVPVTESIKMPPPPPPPAAPEVIEIVEDEEEIEETIIESTEMSQETVIEVLAVDDVNVEEIEEEISVPFAVIENVPIYPGCESAANNDERKKCFQKKIMAHVQKEFKYPQIAAELGIQGKVFVQFAIDSKGKIGGIRTRGPDKNLEKEAARIIALLPNMTPGKQRGRNVRVPYSIPVTFILAQ